MKSFRLLEWLGPDGLPGAKIKMVLDGAEHCRGIRNDLKNDKDYINAVCVVLEKEATAAMSGTESDTEIKT